MKKNILILTLSAFLLSLIPQKAKAQLAPEDEFNLENGAIVNNLDSLLNLWYVKNSTAIKNKNRVNVYGFLEDDVPTYPDSVYDQRIRQIQSPLPYVYNSKVTGFINLYAVRKRDQVEKMLGLSEHYFPIFEEILDKHNMPLEIKYLSIVESALNARAVSRVGATGLWQFMYTTGKLYDLNVNSYMDERRDPYKATEAAALYLKDLHRLFGDWFLAIAAYNCGPGNVNKAIKRSGGKRTFWEIYDHLPAETRGYVPAFIAASYVFTYHKEHNLFPQRSTLPIYVDTVYVDQELGFEPIANVLEMPVEVIRDLNPHFHKDVIPANSKPFVLRLPANKATVFCTMKDSIYVCYNMKSGSVTNEQLAEQKEETKEETPAKVPVKTVAATTASSSTKSNNGLVSVKYTVKSGDNLSYIADWFDVSIYSLRRWNHIKGNMINAGQTLTVMVPSDKVAFYKSINKMSMAQKAKLNNSSASEANTKMAQSTPKSSAPSYKVYTVQKGDTLWSISKQTGMSIDELKKINNITDTRGLQPGQKIKINKS